MTPTSTSTLESSTLESGSTLETNCIHNSYLSIFTRLLHTEGSTSEFTSSTTELPTSSAEQTTSQQTQTTQFRSTTETEPITTAQTTYTTARSSLTSSTLESSTFESGSTLETTLSTTATSPSSPVYYNRRTKYIRIHFIKNRIPTSRCRANNKPANTNHSV